MVKEREIGEILENRKKWMDLRPKKYYDMNISEESQKNIEEAKELSDKNEKLNLILYSDHISFDDPIYIGFILNKIDPEGIRHWIAPVSYSHTSLEFKNSTLKVVCRVAKKCGIETIRVIQAHEVIEDAQKKKSKYKPGEVFGNYKNLTKRFKELGNESRPTAVIIFPEGTRSKDGKLKKNYVTNGMIEMAKKLGDTLFVPISISYNKKFFRGLPLNIGKSVNITVDKPYYYKNGEGETNIDFYMNKVALNLPENMRGEYAQMPETREI